MGNSSSGHAVLNHEPPPWTQSLPRDASRLKKYGAVPGSKVLPERIPGQRLKPTQNGKNLQEQGTISPRKVTELHCPPPDYNPSPNYSTSMTILNMDPRSPCYPYFAAEAKRFVKPGQSYSKSFVSEPDLRGSSPTSNASLPLQKQYAKPDERHKKEKLKSRKRYKAPSPPHRLHSNVTQSKNRNGSISSPNASLENSSNMSYPSKPINETKKRGLFKKKCDSRMSTYEDELMTGDEYSYSKENRVEGRAKQRERSTTPKPRIISSKNEMKERTKSLDNLQYEIRHSLQGNGLSLNSLDTSIDNNRSDIKTHFSAYNQSYLRGSNQHSSDTDKENRIRASLSQKQSRLANRNEVIVHKQIINSNLEKENMSPLSRSPKLLKYLDHYPTFEYHRSSSSCSSCKDPHDPRDEWDLAEKELIERKRKDQKLQNEITNVSKNLRKVSPPKCENSNSLNDLKRDEIQEKESQIKDENVPESDVPKSFFFGMKPENIPIDGNQETNSALSKLNNQDAVKIQGATVECSRENLSDKSKHVRRLKDEAKEKSRLLNNNKKKLTKKIEEFAVAVEREKSFSKADDFSNSITRKGDGGYHSRQNSGSFHLDTENTSDEDNHIRMNLRPILPRRQLELPRFSPNAAWKSLSTEPYSRTKDLRSDLTVNDDIFSIEEDHLFKYTRPTAPPRPLNEKSADSGISGDAGSPGPLQEIDVLSPTRNKTSFGPLAVSSPVASGRIDIKRAWTPAQDLDDNSFEDTNEAVHLEPTQHKISAIPKLTSRSNMFTANYAITTNDYLDFPYKNSQSDNEDSSSSRDDKEKLNYTDYSSPTANFRKLSCSQDLRHESEINDQIDDHWRENWSMSRSITNSINNCDDLDHASEKYKALPESQASKDNIQKNSFDQIRLKGNSGHIMYLPEYKSYQMERKKYDKLEHVPSCHRDSFIKSNGYYSEMDEDRKPPSGDENPSKAEFKEEPRVNNSSDIIQRAKQCISIAGKKGKKFSYQSTVRMQEKKKLEEKLSKEVEEEEKRRRREIAAMSKVEEEFQKKRELEKKKLKKQLKSFQQHQILSHTEVPNLVQRSHTVIHSNKPHTREGTLSDTEYDLVKYHPLMRHNLDVVESYQSLPVDTLSGPPHLSSCLNSEHPQSGMFSGLKNWVNRRKEMKSGYLSDASSVTVGSSSRHEPDGAPAPSFTRQNPSNIRNNIIAASKHRSGNLSYSKDALQSGNSSTSSASSAISRDSHARTSTPNSKRTLSPDSYKSSSIDSCYRGKELHEKKLDQRQYREYRSSERHAFMSNLSDISRTSHNVNKANRNYRKDFCVGNHPSQKPLARNEVKLKELRARRSSISECDRLSDRGHFSTSSSSNMPNNILPGDQQRFTKVTSCDLATNPKGYVASHLTPFKPNKSYHPVPFSPANGKIVSVS